FAESSLFHIFHCLGAGLWAGLWKAARLAENGDHGAAGDDENRRAREPRSHDLRALEEEDGESHPPERLRRDERGDDRDAGPVIGSEKTDVGKAEEDAADREWLPCDPASIRPEPSGAGNGQIEREAERPGRHRDRRTLHRAARGLTGVPADEVVAAREEKSGGEREREGAPTDLRGARWV